MDGNAAALALCVCLCLYESGNVCKGQDGYMHDVDVNKQGKEGCCLENGRSGTFSARHPGACVEPVVVVILCVVYYL